MRYRTERVTLRQGAHRHPSIGTAIVWALDTLRPGEVVVAAVPAMVTYFANIPERYEVTEVDVIIREADL